MIFEIIFHGGCLETFLFFYPLLQMGKAHLQAQQDLEVIQMEKIVVTHADIFNMAPKLHKAPEIY